MYGTSAMSNHPVTELINVIATRVSLIGMSIESTSCVFTVYGSIMYIYTSTQGGVLTSFVGSMPYLDLFVFLDFLHMLHLSTICLLCATNLGQSHGY